MDDRLLINRPIQTGKNIYKKKQKVKQSGNFKESFKKVFAEKLKEKSGVKFSKHAQNRILDREIKITEESLKQLQKGVKKLENKGAQDSLVMIDKVAYVVSVKNKTVVTAIDDGNIKENVFTNIDSAVVL